VIELSASGLGKMDASGLRKVGELRERELRTRTEFLLRGLRLKNELDEFRLPSRTVAAQANLPRFRLGRQVAAAAVIAIGVQAALPAGRAVAEPPPATMQQAGGDQEKSGTVSGTVTDAAGAAVQNAAITITNVATNRAVSLTTNQSGQFTASHLESGKFDVSVVASGFKTTVMKGVEVTAGNPAQLNIKLEIGDWGGCCEYAAAPMKTLNAYDVRVKPFDYNVGEGKDGGTLKGIAKLVYDDPKKWVLIYAANRGVITDPNAVPYGTTLTIPKSHQPMPKLVTKVQPDYPTEAASQKVHGEVAMDVTLNDDGSVQDVKVIEGNPLLNEAAMAAVKQWKYSPLKVNGALVNRFVAVLTFENNGKVH
jgi:TonB family protein